MHLSGVFSKYSTKAFRGKVSNDGAIELTDMGISRAPNPATKPAPAPSQDDITRELSLKAENDATLRLEIEEILVAHGISFKEVAFEKGGLRMPVPYVLVKGTGSVPQLTWRSADLDIAQALVKRDSRNGMFVVDCPPARPVKKRSATSAWFRL